MASRSKKRKSTSGESAPDALGTNSVASGSQSLSKRVKRNLSQTRDMAGTRPSPDIPVEILREIDLYIPSAPFDYTMPESEVRKPYLVDSAAMVRQDTLRALSQVCRAWRAFFWPLAWESVDLASLRTRTSLAGRVTRTVKKAAEEDEARSSDRLAGRVWTVTRALCEEPEVAGTIKNLRVIVTESRIDATLSALLAALDSCNNLETFSIFSSHPKARSSLIRAFERKKFLNVKTLVVPRGAHSILRSFPKVTRLFCTWGGGNGIIDMIGELGMGKQLELLAGVSLHEKDWLKLLKVAPTLPEVRTETDDVPYGMFGIIRQFKNLRRVETRMHGHWSSIELMMDARLEWYGDLFSDCTIVVRPSRSRYAEEDEEPEEVTEVSKSYYIPARENSTVPA